MSTIMGRAFVLLLFAAAVGGCSSCKGDDRPPDAVVEEQAKKRLDEVPELVAKICGVDVKKLVDPTVTVVSSSGATFKVRITGHPAPADAGNADAEDAGADDDDDDDAGAEAGTPRDGGVITSKGKALLCAGIFTIEVRRVLDNDGKLTAWGSGALALESVEKAKSDDPPRRRRHHRRRHHH